MAWRDSRASRRRLGLFSLSIVLGIAAVVAIGSFGANLARAIDTQAKGLLGADLTILTRQKPSPPVQQYLDGLHGEQAHDVSFSSMAVFPTASNATRLVQVQAIAGEFPFYGDFVTAPIDAAAQFRAAVRAKSPTTEAVVEETLLRQFGVEVGGAIKIGSATFKIIGALKKLPGEGSAVSATFAPRVLIPLDALPSTGLVGKPSIIRYRTHIKLPAGANAETIAQDMRARFTGERVSVDTVERRKRDLGQAMQNIEGFLSLVGFVALFLGAIGVASAIAVYVRQKITTVAVLRCLGASGRQSFGVYLVQGVALGLVGAVVGAALGIAVQLALPALVRGVLPFDIDFFIAWLPVLRGSIAGLVICLLFAGLPLLSVRRVSPLTALRSAVAERAASKPDPWRIVLGVLIVVAVTGFAIWQTGRIRLGVGFSGTLLVALAVLGSVAKAVAWAARRISRLPSMRRAPYVVRQGVANLYRPQNRTVLLLFALGLGTFLMLTLYLTRSTLLREVEVSGGEGRANLLFFDVQDDQLEALKHVAADNGAPVQIAAPIVTMKVAAVNGRSVADLLAEAPKPAAPQDGADNSQRRDPRRHDGQRGISPWTLQHEYRSTYRASLTRTEKVVAGEFIGKVPPGTQVVPISLEQGVLDDMHVKLGDEIDWDVQGVPLRTKIASVRRVEWRRLEPNFFVVFPEGVLEAAPKFFVVAMRADTPEISGRVQRAIVARFPNATAIDLALVLQTLDGIFSKVAFVIQFMALFTVATGVIVLIGAVLTGRYQRIRETVLLRTVGAARRQLTRIMLVEYGVLGALAALTGAVLAIAGNALLAKFVFHAAITVPPLEVGFAFVIAVAVTLVAGLAANRGVTNHPPLEVLRQET